MGYIRHHAILITGVYQHDKYIEAAHKEATRIFPWVSPISKPSMNDTRSFFVPPDGSKEGWTESNDGDSDRDAFLNYLDSLRYEDGSSPLEWAEVQYGDDNRESKVLRHSDEERR